MREDSARRAVSAGGADAKADASQDDIAILEKAADAGHSPADPLDARLWHFLRRDDPTQAEHWFRMSSERQGAAHFSEGLALALVASSGLPTPSLRWRAGATPMRAPARLYMAAVANFLAVATAAGARARRARPDRGGGRQTARRRRGAGTRLVPAGRRPGMTSPRNGSRRRSPGSPTMRRRPMASR